MEVPDLKLEGISFSNSPTQTQLSNALRDIHKFLSRVGGAVIADGMYVISDPCMGALFNGAIQLRAAADAIDQGPNATGLAVPRQAPGPQRV